MNTKDKKAPRSRNVKSEEIDNKLRSAGDYLSEMMKHEEQASASVNEPTQDVERREDAYRRFVRDYHAFLSAATIAWNYMNQATDATRKRVWLDNRLSSKLFSFHRALENQAKHDYEIVVGVRQRVRYEAPAGTPMIRSAVGVIPARATITGFERMTYHYNPSNLEPDVAALCESVLRKYPDETVVQLGGRYLDGLRRAFLAGDRKGHFGKEIAAEKVQHAATIVDSQVDGTE